MGLFDAIKKRSPVLNRRRLKKINMMKAWKKP